MKQLKAGVIGLGVGEKHIAQIHQEPRLGNIRHSLADFSKARAFGHRPKYSLEEGLRQTLEEFRLRSTSKEGASVTI